MTHDEAVTLLPAYALGALDADVVALEAHVRDCARCTSLLASYQETTATLGQAVERIAPPPSLRASVLAHVPGYAPERRGRQSADREAPRAHRIPRQFLAIAATLLLVVGLGAGNLAQQQRLRAAQSELALDQLGLALLTSTETTVERMSPVADPTGREHGHWYHHPGIATEVVVVEFMPSLPPGEAYYGWLQLASGAWQPVGPFTLNDQGYGRAILTGSDGVDVRSVVVTRQSQATAAPASDVVLRWPAA